jgi:hypothetical protein
VSTPERMIYAAAFAAALAEGGSIPAGVEGSHRNTIVLAAEVARLTVDAFRVAEDYADKMSAETLAMLREFEAHT